MNAELTAVISLPSPFFEVPLNGRRDTDKHKPFSFFNYFLPFVR